MKILIAEDDPVSCRWLSATLSRLGHEVVAATDGEEAFALFVSQTPPIVISDWTMPNMDGLELCQQIRKLDLEQYTFFILLSAKDKRADYLEAMKADVDDFLQKPLDPEELGIRLRVAQRIIKQRQEANEKIQLWENAVQSFDGAVQLDGKDADARYNLEFVKKKLEELKKQQPKQDQKQQPNRNQDKEEKQQQDRKQQSDSSKQQPNQEQKREQPKPDSQPPEQKDRQPQDQRQEKAENQKQKEEAKQNEQNKPQGADKGDAKPGEQTEANAAAVPGQMTVQQAEQLLDAQKGEERAMIFVPAQKLKEQKRIFKDW